MMMEEPRVMKTINGGEGSQELSLELEPSLSYISFPQQKSCLRVDVSADDDTEISIFDAQRYFNESNSDARVCKRVSPLNMPNLVHVSSEPGCARFSSASSAADGYGYGRTSRVRSFHATPTPSSEASWNSQTGLLSNPPGAIAVSMTRKNPTTDDKRKGSGKVKWLWGRRCPCSGKKSVQVEPKTPLSLNQKLKVEDQKSLATKNSSRGIDHKREEIQLTCNPPRISAENHEFHSSLGQRVVASTTARPLIISHDGPGTAGFTFPILNQQPAISSHVKLAVNRNNNSLHDHEDPPRESLEVFRPNSDESSSISVPKKLVSRITITDDDAGSDTSSDLFEIESFSTTTQSQTMSYPMYHRRDSLDEASNFNTIRSIAAAGNGPGFGCPYSPMMTECYEPSEASIEWSVTTAEGFERGSVGVSEAEEMSVITGHGNGGKKKSGNGGLLSCRCEKAVSVGPNPVKYVPPQGQAATTSKHVGNVKKPPLARLSHPFAA